MYYTNNNSTMIIIGLIVALLAIYIIFPHVAGSIYEKIRNQFHDSKLRDGSGDEAFMQSGRLADRYRNVPNSPLKNGPLNLEAFQKENSKTAESDEVTDKVMSGAESQNDKVMSGAESQNDKVISEAESQNIKVVADEAVVEPSVSIAAKHPTPDQADSSSGWTCNKCGRNNVDYADYCIGCGTPRPGKEPAKQINTGNVETYQSQGPAKNNKMKFIIAGLVIALIAVAVPVANIISSRMEQRDMSYYDDEYSDEYDYDMEDNYEDYDEYDDYEDADVADDDSGFIVGEQYEVLTNLRVREGPGKDYRILSRDELTDEDYPLSVDSTTTTDALIEKGMYVTCLEMSDDWMRISSGWICVYDEGEELVRLD